MKKVVLSIITILTLGANLSAQAPTFVVSPFVSLPLGDSASLISIGAGGRLDSIWSLGTGSFEVKSSVAYLYSPSLAKTSLHSVQAMVGPAYRINLAQTLSLRGAVMAGGYFASYEGVSGGNLSVEAGMGADILLGSSLKLGVGTSFDILLSGSAPLLSGIGISIGATFTPGASNASNPKLQIIDPKFEPVFPVFFKWYDSNPAGTVVIVNKESRPIKNVKASIFIKEFMDAPKVFAEIPSLAKGESRELSVLALLTDKVLGVTESTKVAAEITVSYDLADGSMKVMRAETIRILDRNAMTWANDQRAASFVTARDPAVLALAKDVAGAVREAGGVGSDLDLRIAMGIYQALGLHGVRYVVDPSSSYADFSKNETAVDFLQFPRQTLQYKAGDCDDLTILYTALLESVGIETAFITVPGHILAAVALPLTPDEAERTFSRLDRFLVDKGKVFIPIEATIFSKGFNAAWAEGARQWRLAGTQARIIPVREAWRDYEAVGLRDTPPSLSYPTARTVLASYKVELDRFISDELVPQVARLQEEIKRSGATSKNLNRLGVLYARYGKYPEAESEFQKIIKKDEYTPALINLANLAFLRGEMKSAALLYDRALKKDPKSKVALAGAIRVRSELGETTTAQKHLTTLQNLDPAAAASLASLISPASEGRASATDSLRVNWNEE
jgi:hypothetical protein